MVSYAWSVHEDKKDIYKYMYEVTADEGREYRNCESR